MERKNLWTDRRAAANSRLESCGLKWLNSRLVFQLGFCAGLTDMCYEIPHERQAAKRFHAVNHYQQ